jgi:bifunctional DNA-binding transcriptional regulator/antitoxin component of YhaV-PrlF toxin-antitoxin module
VAIKRKLQRTKKDQYTITIPKALVDILGLEAQDVLEFTLKDEQLILKKRKRGGKHA